MLDPQELYELADELPELDAPVLMQALTGFVDAGGAARLAAEHLLLGRRAGPGRRLRRRPALDYRSRRPAMLFVEDHWESYEEPRDPGARAARHRRHAVPAARRAGAGPAVGAVHRRGARALRAARRAAHGRAQRDPDGGAAHPPARGHRARHPAGADRRPRALAAAGAGAGQRGAPAGVPARPGRAATRWASPCTCRTTWPRPSTRPRRRRCWRRCRRRPAWCCRPTTLRAAADAVRAEIDEQVARSDEVATVVRSLEEQYDAYVAGQGHRTCWPARAARCPPPTSSAPSWSASSPSRPTVPTSPAAEPAEPGPVPGRPRRCRA